MLQDDHSLKHPRSITPTGPHPSTLTGNSHLSTMHGTCIVEGREKAGHTFANQNFLKSKFGTWLICMIPSDIMVK